MIAQTFAIEHPDKTLSLCSIMSTTGDTAVGQPAPDALEMLTSAPPQTVEDAADAAVLAAKVIGGKGFPLDEERIRAWTAKPWNRDHDDVGMARQLVGILASGDRTPGFEASRVPTLVIHGVDDPLVTPSGGEATAKAVPGAELLNLEGMGHDLPIPLWPQIIDAIVDNTAKAEERGGGGGGEGGEEGGGRGGGGAGRGREKGGGRRGGQGRGRGGGGGEGGGAGS